MTLEQADSEYHQGRHYSRVCQDWNVIVDRIRQLPAFSDFVKPPTYSLLRKVAESGPIILINISGIRSDAIIVTRDRDEPYVVPLPDATPERVAKLADGFGRRPAEVDPNTTITLLRDVWDIVVGPVANALQKAPLNVPRGSRIWWCPTGHAARLPLHAAGRYKGGEPGIAHLYISSYTPNLTTLILAREYHASGQDLSEGKPAMLLVGQSDTPGQQALPSASKEVEVVSHSMSDRRSVHVLEGPVATRESVLEGLTQYPWIHLVCHGHRDDDNPFSSHFSLHDGPITLLDLIKKELPQAEFAFLSACHSAGMNRNLPDEYVHPAATMMVAGFKSVVATMWALDDSVGADVAERFYKEMLKEPKSPSGPRGAERAARSLRQAMNSMPKGFPFMQLINLVHYGI